MLTRPHLIIKPGIVAHSCNPNYIGGGDRRIVVQSQPQTKANPYLKNKLKEKELGTWVKW
jgi:hypothetical protein